MTAQSDRHLTSVARDTESVVDGSAGTMGEIDAAANDASAARTTSANGGQRLTERLLTECDREAIHIPSAIQPHGYLLSLDADLTIVQTSSNVAELTGQSVDDVLGRSIRILVGDAGADAIADALRSTDIEAQPIYVGRVAWHVDASVRLVGKMTDRTMADADRSPHAGGERMADMLLHAYDGVVILEIEPTEHVGNVFSPIYALVRTFVHRLQGVRTVEELSALAAREMRSMTGFGRVLVYRFDEEGNGRVLAEDRESHYVSFLNHHFPASDIPQQARALYLRQHLRLIANVDYVPASLVPALHPLTGRPTDLSYAALRSVSPVHLQYMRNMGTASSMSISIVVRNKLWGLVSCHDHLPHAVSFEMRAACEHLGEVLSLQIEAKEDSIEADYRLTLRQRLVELIATMSDRDDFVDSLVSAPHALLRFMSAHGAAVILDGRIVTVGATPDNRVIERLVDRIAGSSTRDVFHCDSLATQMPDIPVPAYLASGLLAVQISRLHRHFVIWFRPEAVRTIEWAGDPRKAGVTLSPTSVGGDAEDGGNVTGVTDAGAADVPLGVTMLSPRKSFETWRETVRNRSLRWRDSEVAIAREFRSAVLSIVLRRAEEMAQIAAELGRVNKELESFSYSVSHDLRAPLRHIVGYGDLLQEYEGDRLTEKGNRFLANIVDSARFAGTLVDDLLTFSQMGRAALRPAPVALNTLVDAVIVELNAEHSQRQIEWQVGVLPTVVGDAAFLMLVVRNLLSNAVKYSQTRTPAKIEIAAHDGGHEHIVSVADNGVGFNMRYVGKLFGVFQRLHRSEDFEGTGIGLANVRRIIERHDGRTWAEGELDKGATFFFTIPKVSALNTPDSPQGSKASEQDGGSPEASC